MKTFINAARIVAVSLLFVSLTSLGFGFGGCCKKSCAPKAPCAVGCKLQPEPVEIVTECNDAGEYKQVCHLEYIPCSGKKKVTTAFPRFVGCYDENGNRLNQ